MLTGTRRRSFLALTVFVVLLGGVLGIGVAPEGAVANHFTNTSKVCSPGTPTFTCTFDIHIGEGDGDTLFAGDVVTVDLSGTSAIFTAAAVTGGTCDAAVTTQTATHLDITVIDPVCSPPGSNIIVSETLKPVGLGGGPVCQQPDTFGNAPILTICADNFSVPGAVSINATTTFGVCAVLQEGADGAGSQTDPATYAFNTPEVLTDHGDSPDHRWVHDFGAGPPLLYDLGTTRSMVLLFPSIDHEPVPGEALEATVFGSNSPLGPWEPGGVTTIFDQGFDPAWISDDFVSLWGFSQPYRYFQVAHGGPLLDDDDAEIDALCAVQPQIDLAPANATNEAGTDHTVTATVTAGGQALAGVLVSFSVGLPAGPNTGEVSDPNTGECTANDDCTTDANGQVSWTYTGAFATGLDVIYACFTEAGQEHCVRVTKLWVDTTPPGARCIETTNPAGGKVPPAGSTTLPGPKGGQNEDGFYQLLATDLVDPNPDIFVHDSASAFVAGPFSSGDKVKITQAPGATPGSKPMSGEIVAHITLKGDAVVVAVDASGNVSNRAFCKVPPPPK